MTHDRDAAEGGPGARPLLLSWSDALNTASERLLFFLMLAMIFFTTLQVVTRVFFTALSWTEEITCFLLVLASLVGTAVAFKRGSHIAVTFLIEFLPAAGQKAMAVLVHLLGIAFFAVVAGYGALLMRTEAQQTSPAMQIPMVWVYTVFPVVGGLIILHLVVGIAATWRRS
jgi:TRAP-type C4-dicarboxylate transport system permease small subunit